MTKPHNLHNCGSLRPSSTRIASASPNSSEPSSETNRTRTVKACAVVLKRCTSRSSQTRRQSHSSAASLERARTSWRRPCCYVTCLSLQTPRHGTFEMRCRVCSTWRQLSKPRAQPLDVEGQPQKNASCQTETRGRCWFIKDHPLKVGKRRPSGSASSTIEGSTTHDMISTSTAAEDMGTWRNVAIAFTAVGVTIATKTE